MKLKSIKSYTTRAAGGETALEAAFNSVDLCVDTTGKKAMSLVDIDVGAATPPTVPITVESDSSASTKGRRRMMMKVSFPYSPVKVDENGTIVVDRTRAGGEVEAHLVISVPRALEQDARAADFGSGRNAALYQLALVQQLLRAICGFGPEENLALSSAGAPSRLVATRLPLASLDGSVTLPNNAQYQLGPVRSDEGLAIPAAAYRLRLVDGYGNPRFDRVESADFVVRDLALPTNAWMRGLSGLPPLACGQEIVVNGATELP